MQHSQSEGPCLRRWQSRVGPALRTAPSISPRALSQKKKKRRCKWKHLSYRSEHFISNALKQNVNEMLSKRAFHLKRLEMKCEWNTYESEHFIWNSLKWKMQMKRLSERAFRLKQWKCNSNIALHFQEGISL
jgi:hypothetical protein